MLTPRHVEVAWCPPYVEGQSKVLNDLKMELISEILSYLPLDDLVRDVVVCKKWWKSVQRYPPFQWRCAFLYHAPKDLEAWKVQHKLVSSITFMRQFPEEAIESLLSLFKGQKKLEHINFTCHNVPNFVGDFKGLRTLRTEGQLTPTLLDRLSVASHRTMMHLDLARDASASPEARQIPGMKCIKEFGQLRVLNLEGCKGEGLNYILQNSAMMRHLNLGFIELSNIHCQLIGGNMFHLRSLVLRSTEVSDDGLYEIGLGCKKLEHVFLENCKKIGAQGVVDLIANCTDITVLKLAGCSQLRDDTVFALSSARKLQELDVQMLDQVSPKAWYILASKCVDIRLFHAWGTQLTEEVIAKFHRRCIVYHQLTSRNKRAESIATPDFQNNRRKKNLF